MIELVYARACSTPGPGFYSSDAEGGEFGQKVFLERRKRAWQLKPKTFTLKSKKPPLDHSKLEVTSSDLTTKRVLEISSAHIKGISTFSNGS